MCVHPLGNMCSLSSSTVPLSLLGTMPSTAAGGTYASVCQYPNSSIVPPEGSERGSPTCRAIQARAHPFSDREKDEQRRSQPYVSLDLALGLWHRWWRLRYRRSPIQVRGPCLHLPRPAGLCALGHCLHRGLSLAHHPPVHFPSLARVERGEAVSHEHRLALDKAHGLARVNDLILFQKALQDVQRVRFVVGDRGGEGGLGDALAQLQLLAEDGNQGRGTLRDEERMDEWLGIGLRTSCALAATPSSLTALFIQSCFTRRLSIKLKSSA